MDGKKLIYADDLIESIFEDFEIDGANFAKVKQHINAAPAVDAVVHGHCDWCKPGEELCGTCRMFFDYYGDGGSDKCPSECNSKKCAYYVPIDYCPNCGAKMDGGNEDENKI